jgi:hypothetical protein
MERLKDSRNTGLVDLFYNDVYGLNIAIDYAMKDIKGMQYVPNPINQLLCEVCSSSRSVGINQVLSEVCRSIKLVRTVSEKIGLHQNISPSENSSSNESTNSQHSLSVFTNES